METKKNKNKQSHSNNIMEFFTVLTNGLEESASVIGQQVQCMCSTVTFKYGTVAERWLFKSSILANSVQ